MLRMDPINQCTEIYNRLWMMRDTRMEGWMFMDSIKLPLFYLALYFTFVVYGPKWMSNRQPFNLRWFIFVYNFSVSILNLYIFKELAICTYRQGYNWLCEPVRTSCTHPDEMRIIAALHLYGVSKLLEFLDTVFIIVRKKNNQLSFLHVYHHSSMLFVCWLIGRWLPGGTPALGAMINALVHVVMYGYYGLSVLGAGVAKFLWWKKYLTVMQLVQFLAGFLIGVNIFLFGCEFPKWAQISGLLYVLSYLVLFGRFYVSAYVVGKSKEKIACD